MTGTGAKFGVILLVALGAMATFATPLAAGPKDTVFGNIVWGISREEVREAEQQTPDAKLSGKDTLVFGSKFLGENVLLEYAFSQDKLSELKCVFTKYLDPLRDQRNESAAQFILDYLKINKRLTKKYGEPQERGTAGASEVLKTLDLSLDTKDPKKVAMTEQAIRRGSACWYSAWKTEDTLVVLFLRGARGAIRLEIDYAALTWGEEEPEGTLPRD